MTGKEALDKIKERYLGVVNGLTDSKCDKLCKSITIGGTTYELCPKDELDIIEKDLEVLDILKKCDDDIGTFYYVYVLNAHSNKKITDEEAQKVAEWLKYDK